MIASYETERVGGVDHIPRFISKCKCGNVEAVGEESSTKKDAEKMVAEKMMTLITTSVKDTTPKDSGSMVNENDVSEVWMIDAENLPHLLQKLEYRQNTQIFVYFNRTHHLSSKHFPSFIITRISPSTRQDGTDVLMTMDIPYIPIHYPVVKKIVLFTRDKFASACVDNAPLILDNIEVVHNVDFS
jgi:hypothetical protein